MRLPNGYGSTYKLSGNRRRPWIARKTIGWSDEGKQLYQIIGYFKDRPEALQALAEFNKNPYSVEAAKITFAEIYERWKEENYRGKLDRRERSRFAPYKAAFARSAPLHDMIFVEIRKAHMQPIIDTCEKGYETKKKIKGLFNQLYQYALENDITKNNYARFVKIPGEEAETTRRPFSQAEIDLLWDNLGRMDYIDTVLIMIYTGLRPGELMEIETANIFLDKRYMRGGFKTRAGKNRVIPINKKIHPLIEARLSGGEYLIMNPTTGQRETYWNYNNKKWKQLMEQLQMNHRPHDCRHTFASLMDTAGANKLCIKRIIGHKSQDLTDRVYTHKEIQELIAAVDMI